MILGFFLSHTPGFENKKHAEPGSWETHISLSKQTALRLLGTNDLKDDRRPYAVGGLHIASISSALFRILFYL